MKRAAELDAAGWGPKKPKSAAAIWVDAPGGVVRVQQWERTVNRQPLHRLHLPLRHILIDHCILAISSPHLDCRLDGALSIRIRSIHWKRVNGIALPVMAGLAVQ